MTPEQDFEPTRPNLLDAFSARPDDPPQAASSSALTVTAPSRQGAVKCEVTRDDAKVLQRVKTMAATAGEHWYYRYPVQNRKLKRTDWIEGLTVKGANDVARIYGNCEIDTRVIDLGDSWLIMARFLDLETGFAMTRPYQQRKSQRSIGGDDVERQRDQVFQTGVSKAIRNVVTNSLQSITDFAFEEAKGSLVGVIGRDLEKWRKDTLKKLEMMKIEPRRAEAITGRTVTEWDAGDIAQVRAMMKTVKEELATADDTFPALGKPAEDEEKSESKVAEFAAEPDAKPST